VIEAPEKVRRVALGRGQGAWLEGVDALARSVADDWGLTLGATLTGGTEAVVVEASLPDGTAAALKLAIPGGDPTHKEARVLRAGEGRGYVRLFRHDADRSAMLLERLGPQLAQLGLPYDEQLQAICATLREAWRPPPAGEVFSTGAEHAGALLGQIEEAADTVSGAFAPKTVAVCQRFAKARAAAFDLAASVLGHGDAHAWNTLLVPGDGPRRFKLVDPDGHIIERAHDLSIWVRELSAEHLGEPVAPARALVARLAELSGVGAEAIWQWGVLERAANGAAWASVGGLDHAQQFFIAANAWAAAED
jgi:streptomycin 6-kinase